MEGGEKVAEEERRREEGGRSEGFSAKARDVCKTDVGLCLGNGPWVALLAWFSARGGWENEG